jgi:hypothetical protein
MTNHDSNIAATTKRRLIEDARSAFTRGKRERRVRVRSMTKFAGECGSAA